MAAGWPWPRGCDVTLFANAGVLAHDFLEQEPGRYDALYLPRATFHTGDLNTHDVAFQGEDLLLVNTRFSCLARLSTRFNFTPFWRPSFVTDLVPEDRCHLNGLAMEDGQPRFVTALGTTDGAGAWRQNKAQGGVLIELQSGRIVLDGLSMPHSPRCYGGRLWVLNSGTGELLLVDPVQGRSVPVCRLPGYLRGLAFVGPYALVGLSKIRERHIFGGLPIQKDFDALRCGVGVVDLRSGRLAGLFEFTSGCEELYDVQFLPGVRRPMILNLQKEAVRQAMTEPDSSYWLRPSSLLADGSAGAAPKGPSSITQGPWRSNLDDLSVGSALRGVPGTPGDAIPQAAERHGGRCLQSPAKCGNYGSADPGAGKDAALAGIHS